MNTLKTAAMTVVLLGVLYGVYVALNKPQHLPVALPPAEGPPPVVEFSPPQSPAPRAVLTSPTLLPGNEPSPVEPARSAQARWSQPESPQSALPPTSAPASKFAVNAPEVATTTPPRRGTFESPAAAEKAPPPVEYPVAASTEGSRAEAAPASAEPSSAASSGASPTLAAFSLRRDLQEAEQLVNEGKFKAALAKLSPYYASPELDSEQRTNLKAWLDALAAKVIYSREHHLAEAHPVRKNETLLEIADQYKVPWRLLANINSHAVTDTMALVPGTNLKVVPGPFRADVNLAAGELTLYLNELYAGHFPLTIGDQPPTPGQYKVLDKMSQQKSYYALDGRVIPANDPANPYGGWWLSLGGEIAIHGSPATPANQTLGCISLSPQDAKDVYGILAMGAEVNIRR